MNNFEKIKQMNIDEMAELILICFFTQDKNGKKTKQYLGFDGECYSLLSELTKANKQWLQEESEEENDL